MGRWLATGGGLASSLLLGCSLAVASATSQLAGNLQTAILAQDDVETVRQGAPAYLLLLDGLLEGDPASRPLLLAASRLYGAYASAFVDEPARARQLTGRSFDYARRALCDARADLCRASAGSHAAFVAALAETSRGDVTLLYAFGAAWAGWIQARSDDWRAVADLPKVEALMERVLALAEAHDDGGAHLYLGVLLTLRPASLGGRPEEARAHFERALELDRGRNLMTPVLYARHYARLVFDRELHDHLLEGVLAAQPDAPERALSNALAKREARALLDGADEYF